MSSTDSHSSSSRSDDTSTEALGVIPDQPMKFEDRIHLKQSIYLLVFWLKYDGTKMVSVIDWKNFVKNKLKTDKGNAVLKKIIHELYYKVQILILGYASLFGDELVNHHMHMWSYAIQEGDPQKDPWQNDSFWTLYYTKKWAKKNSNQQPELSQ